MFRNKRSLLVMSAGFAGLIALAMRPMSAQAMTIAIDPGHGGTDPGAVGNGLVESNLTLKLSQYLQQELMQYEDTQTLLTRTWEPITKSLKERALIAKDARADLMVSVHINSGGGSGAAVWIPNNSSYQNGYHSLGQRLGNNILWRLVNTGFSNYGLHTRDWPYGDPDVPLYPDGSWPDYYGIIREPRFLDTPSILVEHGFIDNWHDASMLANDAKLRQIARADAEGIAVTYGLEKLGSYAGSLSVSQNGTNSLMYTATLNNLKSNVYYSNIYFEVEGNGEKHTYIPQEQNGVWVAAIAANSDAGGQQRVRAYATINGSRRLIGSTQFNTPDYTASLSVENTYTGNSTIRLSSGYATDQTVVNFKITSPTSNLVLNIPSRRDVDGSYIATFDATQYTVDGPIFNVVPEYQILGNTYASGQSAALYKPVAVQEGIYNLSSSANTSFVLDLAAANRSNGANIQLFTNNQTLAQWFSLERGLDGYYTIKNMTSGKVLDVTAGRTYNGANIQQFDSNGTDAQKFLFVESNGFYSIINKKSGKAIDISAARIVNGSNIQIYDANMSKAQLFNLVRKGSYAEIDSNIYSIRSLINSNYVLDMSGGSMQSGANLEIFESNDTAAQAFMFDKSVNGTYIISNYKSANVFDVAGANPADGTNIWMYSANYTPAQAWRIIKLQSGGYVFISEATGKVLDVTGAAMYSGNNVQQWYFNNTSAQKFTLKPSKVNTAPIADGTYAISSVLNAQKVLDVPGASRQANVGLQIYDLNATKAQLFTFRSANGYYTIQNANSGLYLRAQDGIGRSITQAQNNGGDYFQWRVVQSGSGYAFVNKATHKVLDINAGLTSNGTRVQTWDGNDTASQIFTLIKGAVIVDKNLTLAPSSHPQSKLSASSAGVSAKAETDPSQIWTLVGSTDHVAIKNLMTGKYITSSGLSSNPEYWSARFAPDGNTQFINAAGQALTFTGSGVTVAANAQNANQSFILDTNTSNIYFAKTGMTLDAAVAAQVKKSGKDEQTIRAIMDPATLTTQGYNSEFLRIDTGYSGLSAAQLNAFIDSTSPGQSGILHNMGQAFVQASQQYRMNEAYLLAHAILETGWGTSKLSQGIEKDGVKYYNFFGIGAFDAAAVEGGSATAVKHNWNSPQAAILGGASWIASGYTYGSWSQNTLYKMRFNLPATWHQYATSTTWAGSVAKLIDRIYTHAGYSPSLIYEVPQYN